MAVQESREEGQNSNPTVTGTGTENNDRDGQEAQAVESIGAGDGI